MKKFKKILKILLIALLVLYISGSVVAVQVIYGTLFHRVEAPDYSGYLCYSDIAADYPRREVHFPSGEVQLTGWLYGEDNDDGLVVMAHGLGSTAESYLHITRWFVDRGYRVLTYDATGTGASGGRDTRGLSQSVLDLDAALDWVEADETLDELPLLLFGHSWGGYAAARVLAYGHDVTATVSVSAYDSPMGLMCETAGAYCGPAVYAGYPFLYLQQWIRFGSAANGSAAAAINDSEVPVLLVHGTADTTISHDGAGLISRDFTGDNVTTLSLEGEDHMSLLRPQDAAYQDYLTEVNAVYADLWAQYDGQIPDSLRAEYYASVDKTITGGVNEELMEQIDAFYRAAAALPAATHALPSNPVGRGHDPAACRHHRTIP